MAQPDVLRQLRQLRSLKEQLLAPDDDGIAGFTTSDFPESRGVFFFGDVHPVMRHAVAKEELDRFQRLLVVLGSVHTHPLEIRCHQQLASALKSAPNTGSQRWLAHQHLTDSIRRDADSFHHGGSLTGTDRAAASKQINVTRELPSSVADYAGRLVRRDIHYANIARDDHVAVEGLATRTKDFLARGERAACAELRTFRQLGCGENRKGHRGFGSSFDYLPAAEAVLASMFIVASSPTAPVSRCPLRARPQLSETSLITISTAVGP